MAVRIEEIEVETTDAETAPTAGPAPAARMPDLWRLAAALRREDERRARLRAD